MKLNKDFHLTILKRLLTECKTDEIEKYKKFMEKYLDKKTINEIASQLGKLGGDATKKKYGKSHYSEAGKKGMLKRWNKALVTTHSQEK